MLSSKMVKNAHLACRETFDVQLKDARPLELVDNALFCFVLMHRVALRRAFATYKALPEHR